MTHFIETIRSMAPIRLGGPVERTDPGALFWGIFFRSSRMLQHAAELVTGSFASDLVPRRSQHFISARATDVREEIGKIVACAGVDLDWMLAAELVRTRDDGALGLARRTPYDVHLGADLKLEVESNDRGLTVWTCVGAAVAFVEDVTPYGAYPYPLRVPSPNE